MPDWTLLTQVTASLLFVNPDAMGVFWTGAAKLIHRLAEEPWVESLQLLDERTQLRVALRDPTQLFDRLAHWIKEDGLQIDRFQTADGNLTALFESLLRHHRGESR